MRPQHVGVAKLYGNMEMIPNKLGKATYCKGLALQVLRLIEQQDMYSYQILKKLQSVYPKNAEPQEGRLFPLLKFMQNQTIIEAYEKNASYPHTRVYYRITPVGRKRLAEMEQEKRRCSDAGSIVSKWRELYGAN